MYSNPPPHFSQVKIKFYSEPILLLYMVHQNVLSRKCGFTYYPIPAIPIGHSNIFVLYIPTKLKLWPITNYLLVIRYCPIGRRI